MSCNVLLVDDDDDFRKLMTLRLKSFLTNPTIFEFGSLTEAREGYAAMQAPHFDLVVLDQHLPDGRGVELLQEGMFENMVVLAVSSDSSPEMPGQTVSAGAAYFLPKDQVRSPLFQPLVKGVIDRNRLQRQLLQKEIDQQVMEMVRTHIGTLRHEINNPLGAVLGAAYLVRNSSDATEDQVTAANLVEKSGKRIQHVLDQICNAMEKGQELETVNKAQHNVFHIPGDEPWDDGSES